LCYAGAHLDSNIIKYRGVNQYTRKWGDLHTYSGKIVENITQAVSRDILANGMYFAEKAGYKIILTVHDEILTEVPDTREFAHKDLSALLATRPPWAPDLPLAAAGFEAKRYRKD
jgi:DNA polymerase